MSRIKDVIDYESRNSILPILNVQVSLLINLSNMFIWECVL